MGKYTLVQYPNPTHNHPAEDSAWTPAFDLSTAYEGRRIVKVLLNRPSQNLDYVPPVKVAFPQEPIPDEDEEAQAEGTSFDNPGYRNHGISLHKLGGTNVKANGEPNHTWVSDELDIPLGSSNVIEILLDDSYENTFRFHLESDVDNLGSPCIGHNYVRIANAESPMHGHGQVPVSSSYETWISTMAGEYGRLSITLFIA
jgi:hypothetical protein